MIAEITPAGTLVMGANHYITGTCGERVKYVRNFHQLYCKRDTPYSILLWDICNHPSAIGSI